MLALRILAGLALGPSVLVAAVNGAPQTPAASVRAASSSVIAWAARTAPPRAQIAVRFDDHGRIAQTALVRSSGSRAADAAAEEAALQLADLEPAGAAAGRTRVYSVALPAGS